MLVILAILYLGYKLYTFCLARDFVNVALLTIFIAY
jgi:hypothetical protein